MLEQTAYPGLSLQLLMICGGKHNTSVTLMRALLKFFISRQQYVLAGLNCMVRLQYGPILCSIKAFMHFYVTYTEEELNKQCIFD